MSGGTSDEAHGLQVAGAGHDGGQGERHSAHARLYGRPVQLAPRHRRPCSRHAMTKGLNISETVLSCSLLAAAV